MRLRLLGLTLGLGVFLGACAAPDSGPEAPQAASGEAPAESSIGDEVGRAGGRLSLAMTEEPRTFNPLTAITGPSLAVAELLHGDLVHFDPRRFEVLPALADTVEVSDDGKTYRFALRRGLSFSDGEPFDAEDVMFTFRVLLDPEVESPQKEALEIDGQPVVARALDSHTVEVELPSAIANGAQLFDALPIVPEHRLAGPYAEGRIGEVWGIGTDPAELVGLGPFRVRGHEPGQRLVLERNPHYWKRDADGQPLPYLDEVVISYVADEDARVLRFLAGESDLIEGPSPDSFTEIRQRAEVRAVDLGPGLTFEFLHFNLNDLEDGSRPQIAAKQAWFRQLDFRRALSLAIDRQSISRLVYRGMATPVGSSVTAANRRWHDPALVADEHDPERASALLEGLGFRRDESGTLRDGQGKAVELTLVTNSSNARRVRAATVIQEDLRRLGIELAVVPLDFGDLLDRIYESFDYELCLLGLGRGSTDPTSAMNIWQSDGDSHLWRIQRRQPLPPWQEEVDSLLDRQRVELDPTVRKGLYDRAQALVSENVPLIFLVSPNVLAGAHPDLGNFAPAPLEPIALWNIENLYWRAVDDP